MVKGVVAVVFAAVVVVDAVASTAVVLPFVFSVALIWLRNGWGASFVVFAALVVGEAVVVDDVFSLLNFDRKG